MLLRGHPDPLGPDSAQRLLAVLGPGPARVVGGWVPAVPAPAAPVPEAAPVGVPAAVEGGPAGGRSWRSALPGVLAGGRGDPGRAGVVALVVLALLGAALGGAMLLRSRPSPVPLVSTAVTAGPEAPAAAEVVVDVAGAVASPGVRRLPEGARVIDALEAAGGVLPGTDTTGLNLARPLRDGEQVLVGGPPAAGGAQADGGLVDLNTADEAALDALPGVGPVMAGRILAWRESSGPFLSVDQLREIDGVGEATYARLSPLVTV